MPRRSAPERAEEGLARLGGETLLGVYLRQGDQIPEDRADEHVGERHGPTPRTSREARCGRGHAPPRRLLFTSHQPAREKKAASRPPTSGLGERSRIRGPGHQGDEVRPGAEAESESPDRDRREQAQLQGREAAEDAGADADSQHVRGGHREDRPDGDELEPER